MIFVNRNNLPSNLKLITYDEIEVDSTNKIELREYEKAGYEIYGIRRDLRDSYPTFLKLRKENL